MRLALKALPLGLLGVAVACLVACGDRSGLLAGTDAGSLQDALVSVQSACAAGDTSRAALDAQRFADRVAELSPRRVDARLIADLQDGARTLEALVPRTCTATTSPPATVTTAPTTSTPTTTTDTTTTPTTTTTTPTTPTEPTTPTTTAPQNGGGSPGEGGGQAGGGEFVPPGQAKKGNGGAGDEGGDE